MLSSILISDRWQVPGLLRASNAVDVLLAVLKACSREESEGGGEEGARAEAMELATALMAFCVGSMSQGGQMLQEQFGSLSLQIATTAYVDGGLGWQATCMPHMCPLVPPAHSSAVGLR